MAFADKIAIGILIFCILLGGFGLFKWLVRVLEGILVGIAVLVCVALLVNNPHFNDLSKGTMKGGTIIPYIRNQITIVQDLIISDSNEPTEPVTEAGESERYVHSSNVKPDRGVR